MDTMSAPRCRTPESSQSPSTHSTLAKRYAVIDAMCEGQLVNRSRTTSVASGEKTF